MQLFVRKLRMDQEHNISDIILGDFNFIDHSKDKKNGLNAKDKLMNTVWILLGSKTQCAKYGPSSVPE